MSKGSWTLGSSEKVSCLCQNTFLAICKPPLHDESVAPRRCFSFMNWDPGAQKGSPWINTRRNCSPEALTRPRWWQNGNGSRATWRLVFSYQFKPTTSGSDGVTPWVQMHSISVAFNIKIKTKSTKTWMLGSRRTTVRDLTDSRKLSLKPAMGTAKK